MEFEDEVEIDLTGCLAKYAPEPEQWKRDSWCTMPHICRTSKRHQRPPGLANEKITSTKIADGKIDPSWQILHPKLPTDGAGRKGRGKGGAKGRGRGGKGKGFQR